MRILYLSRDYTTHDRRFLVALAGFGQEVFYLRLEKRNPPQEERPPPPGIAIVPWAGGATPFSLARVPYLLPSLRRVIRAVRPDLIHAGPLQTAGLLAALTRFRPLVTMSWGTDLLVDADRSAWSRWITRQVLRRSDVMVGDCESVLRKATVFGFPQERVMIFPWGVDLELFTPSASARPDGPTFTLLSTRNWEPTYGVDVLAGAFVRAAKTTPSLRLIMLGDGSLEGMLRRTFAGGGVNGQVVLRDRVGNDDLPSLYRQADVYLSASHSDGTSVSLLEALASGCPVLASDIPGNREWIRPGYNGWLFPDGDVEALVRAISHAFAERKKLPTMGFHARQVAEERADWTKNSSQLLAAYELALATVRAPHSSEQDPPRSA